MINLMMVMIWLFFLVVGVAFPDGMFALGISCLTFIFIGQVVNARSSLHMMFFLGYGVFLFVPSVVNWYFLGIDFVVFFLSSLAAFLFLIWTRKTTVCYFVDYGFYMRGTFIVFCFISLLMVFFGVSIDALMALMIALMSMSFRQGEIRNNAVFFAFYVMLFLMFLAISWNGFGRTVIMGWLMLAGLQFAYSIGVSINRYLFSLFPALAATLLTSRDFLQLNFLGFEHALNDSAYSPYRLASSFIYYFNDRGFDVSGFIDQVVFTFFVFIPRSIWPEKPQGFGSEYTIRHLDSRLVDAGHSVASTLIGDHIYYLGYFGVVTAMIVIMIFAGVANFLYRIKGLNGNGVLLFSASMMVLVWGGMTSFSARIAMPGIIFISVFFGVKYFIGKKIKV